MNIVNKQPRETADINAARNTAFSELLKLTALAVVLIGAIVAGVTLSVNIIVTHIPYEVEQDLFEDVYPAQMLDNASTRNSDSLQRAQHVLDTLEEQPGAPPLDYNLFLMEEAKPNAFAFPGGGIGVTKGLLEDLENDISLAFVIGHELGHFKNRDHLRGIGRSVGLSIVFSVVFGSAVGNDQLLNICNSVLQRQYSRKQELKADRFGVKMVHQAYGETKGVSKLFEVLQEKDIPSWAYMFSTHPSPEKRIERLRFYTKTLQAEAQ